MALNLDNPVPVNETINSLMIDNFSSDERRKIIYIDNHRVDSTGNAFANKVEPMPEPYYSAIYADASTYAGGADIHGAVIQAIFNEIGQLENLPAPPTTYTVNAFSIDTGNATLLVSYNDGSVNKDFFAEGPQFTAILADASNIAGFDVYVALKYGLYTQLSLFYGTPGTIV